MNILINVLIIKVYFNLIDNYCQESWNTTSTRLPAFRPEHTRTWFAPHHTED